MDSSKAKSMEPVVGFLKWTRDRESWRLKRAGSSSSTKKGKGSETINVDEVIEHIFAQPSSRPLPVPIPLPQMIDILVDFWEADGLYD